MEFACPEGKANNRLTPKSYNVMSGSAKALRKKIRQVGGPKGQRAMEDEHTLARVLWHGGKASEPQVVH